MGWRDDPLVGQGQDQPKWKADPLAEAAPKPAAPKAKEAGFMESASSAIAEPIMALGSGAIAYPAGAVAGFGGLALEGLRQAGLPIPERDPLKIQQDIQQGMTYQPRTQAGQTVMAPLQWLGEQIGGAAGGARELVAPPRTSGPLQSAIGAGVEEGVKQLPTFLGAAAPKIAGATSGGLRSGAERLMQSALKPTLGSLQTGKAQSAIDTLLEKGINPTKGGAEALQGRIDVLNDQIVQRIAASPLKIDKAAVLGPIKEKLDQFVKQVTPSTDLAAIQRAWEDFMNHPLLDKDIPVKTVDTGILDASGKPITRTTAAHKAEGIPVPLAQALKQGTYRSLGEKAYGELKGADIEAQKALARGLKEEIAKAVPEVRPLNAEESKLLTALNQVERRVLMSANRNPIGLGWLTANPARFVGWLADRSDLFKSLVARMLNTGSRAAPPLGAVAPVGGMAISGQANQIPPPPQ